MAIVSGLLVSSQLLTLWQCMEFLDIDAPAMDDCGRERCIVATGHACMLRKTTAQPLGPVQRPHRSIQFVSMWRGEISINAYLLKLVAMCLPEWMNMGDKSHLGKLYGYDYNYIMAPQRVRPYGANLGSMGRNTGTLGRSSWVILGSEHHVRDVSDPRVWTSG